MLAPRSAASGPAVAKRGGGSAPAISVSRVVVAGDAQATTNTRSVSAHTRGRIRSVTAVRLSLMRASLIGHRWQPSTAESPASACCHATRRAARRDLSALAKVRAQANAVTLNAMPLDYPWTDAPAAGPV